MKLTRNKTIGMLGLLALSFLLNLFSFGRSFDEAMAYNVQDNSQKQVRVEVGPETVVMASSTSLQVSVNAHPKCGPVTDEAFALQDSTSAFLLVSQDCFSLSLGHVSTVSKLVVLDSGNKYSVAVQAGSGDSFSLPISLRSSSKTSFEVVLPSVQTAAEKAGVITNVEVLIIPGVFRLTKEGSSKLDIAYLQVFRC